MKPRSPGTLLIFYILVSYILIQLIWWAWLLLELNNEIYLLQNELNLHKNEDPASIMQKGNELLSALHKRRTMIAGEGIVFLGLLLAGVAMTRRSLHRERDAMELQKNFLLSVTHELRTPIASLRLQLETLAKRELEKEKQKELLQDCLKDTDRLTSLVENILLASRLESKKAQLSKERLDLNSLAASCAERMQVVAGTSHPISFLGEEEVIVEADRTAMQSVIMNLLENAVKYSPAGTPVRIQTSRMDSTAILTVSDLGRGIPDAEKKKVFNRFYRIGNEETRRTKGTGLGLFIARMLVQSHGGMISVRDNSPSGCIFEVSIPL